MSQVTQSGLKSSQNIQAEKAIDQVEGFVLYPGVMGAVEVLWVGEWHNQTCLLQRSAFACYVETLLEEGRGTE